MRLKKEKIPFTQVANEVLNNKGLSWKAKGLYAYLFSKPDDWNFSNHRMVQETADGRVATMTALRELEDSGYLQRKKLSNGRMEYTLKHSTQSEKTELREEKPKLGFRTVQKSHSEETSPVSNKEGTSNIDNVTVVPSPFLFPKKQGFKWEEYLKGMFEDNRDHINIIALYFREKMLRFDTPEQASVAIKRHLVAATQVSKWPEDKIMAAVQKARREWPENWTIETVLKVLTR